MIIDKVPPQAIEVEAAVLGAVIVDKTGFYRAAALISKNSFYKPAHQDVWQALCDLDNSGASIDQLTVVEQLRKNGTLEVAGGIFFIGDLTKSVVSASNIETHCKILQQKEILRKGISIGSELISEGHKQAADSLQYADLIEKQVVQLSNIITRGSEVSIESLCKEIIAEQVSPEDFGAGIDTPITKLTETTHGWQPGHLTVIAARPGMGKTTLALQQINTCIDSGIACGFISLEMTGKELLQKLGCQRAGISHQQVQKRELELDDIEKLRAGLQKISTNLLQMDDRASSMVEIKSKAVRWKIENNMQLLVVDYLQLISSSGRSREEEVSSISRGLKLLAKELDISIIALSQLNRECEKRTPQKPKLSDLRESGAIEQDADRVIMMWRPELYGHSDIQIAGQDYLCQSLAEISIEKNRHGVPRFDIAATFNKKSVAFTDYVPIEVSESFGVQVPQFAPVNGIKSNSTDDLPF